MSPYYYTINPGTVTYTAHSGFTVGVGSGSVHSSSGLSYTSASDSAPLDLVPGMLRGYRQWRPTTLRQWSDAYKPGTTLNDVRNATTFSLESLSAAFIWNEPQARAACYRRFAECPDGDEECKPVNINSEDGTATSHVYGYDLWECPHHVPPVRTCSCGLYATHQPLWYGGNTPGTVVGVVNAWGKIELGTQGFRAQHARIVGLSVIEFAKSYAHIGDGLGHFGVPVFRDPREMIEALPPIGVEHLLAKPTVTRPEPEQALTEEGIKTALTDSIAKQVAKLHGYWDAG